MTGTGRVRRARAEDVAALLALRVVMFEAMGTPAQVLADPVWRQAAATWLTERLDDQRTRLVVADADGAVASGAVGEVSSVIPGPSCPNGSVGLISNVATLAPFRGRGLAAACTEDLVRWFDGATDVTRIDLFATEPGSLIYRNRGFSTSPFPAMRRPVAR